MLHKMDRRIPIVLSLQHRSDLDNEGRCHGYGSAAEEDSLDIFTRSAVVIARQRTARRQGLENGLARKETAFTARRPDEGVSPLIWRLLEGAEILGNDDRLEQLAGYPNLAKTAV